MNVKEAACQAGTSARTLRYYEEKGLIQPVRQDANGYRDYDLATIDRVRTIRVYRELQFSLEQIRELLDASRAERNAILQTQIEALEKQKQAIEHRIALTTAVRMIGSERLKEIDVAALDVQMEQAQHILDKNEDARQFSERFCAQSRQKAEQVQVGLIDHLAAVANAPDARVDRAIVNLQDFIGENFYPCTHEILLVYARSYGGDGALAQMLDDVAGEGASMCLRKRMEEWLAEQG